MRWRVLIAMIVGWLPAALATGAEFPYTAYVNSADVYVRSGPGRDYYPTDKLAKGQEVEVYRHDPGGWLAIRPPRGSYSWVSARHLDIAKDDLAVVNSERVVARVGSTLGDMRDVIQVRLEKDERVELLEAPAADSPWCKIAPPAGEFRWVFSKYVDQDLPSDLAQDAREAGARGQVRLTGNDEPTTPADAQAAAELSAELNRLRELDAIDMDLSAIVAGDLSTWNFGNLHQRAEQALRSAQGGLERGRARMLMSKLARFEDIKQRHSTLKQPAPASASAPAPAVAGAPAPNQRLAGAPPVAAMPVGRRADDPRYDGIGKLAPVVSQKTGGPQFALVDASGTVLSFVTPAPGVNLRPFVDRQVGVNGQRSYLYDVQRPHISVQRVAVIDPGVQRR